MEAVALSIVVPCYNEEEVLYETHGRIMLNVSDITKNFEIIYINDGSKDKTGEILNDIASKESRVKAITFSRNFGHQLAVSAGLDSSLGEAVVIIDADLQDPPEVIKEMYGKWAEGYKVVYGKRKTRKKESFFKLFTSKAFYKIFNHLSETAIPLDTGDFRLIDRSVVDVLKNMPEQDRFLRGMVSWIGFKQCAVYFDREKRFAGASKYRLRKMIEFSIDGITSFSIKPLRMAMWVGLVMSLVAFLGIIALIVGKICFNYLANGWVIVAIIILFIGGVQFVCMGVMGEYIGRIYMESKNRPLYIIAQDQR